MGAGGSRDLDPNSATAPPSLSLLCPQPWTSVSQCLPVHPIPPSASQCLPVHRNAFQCVPVHPVYPIALQCIPSHRSAPSFFHFTHCLPLPPEPPSASQCPQAEPPEPTPFALPLGTGAGTRLHPGRALSPLPGVTQLSPRSLGRLPSAGTAARRRHPPPGVTTPIPAGDSGLDPLGPVSPGLSGFSSAAASAAPRAPGPCPRHPGEQRGHPALPWGHRGWPPAGCWGMVGGGDPTAVLSHRLGWGPVAASARGGDRQGACPRSLRDAHRGRAPGPPVGGAAQVRWLLPRAALLHHRLQGQAQEPRPGGAGRGGRPALGAGAHQADGAAAGHEPAGEARPVSFVGQRGVAWGQLGDSPGTALGQPGDSLGRFP